MSLWNLTGVLFALLMCVVPLAGVIVTGMGRRTHGRAAVIGMLGCVALLLQGLVQLGQTLFLSTMIQSIGPSTSTVIALVSLISSLLMATGVSLLIWAVVARRGPAPAGPAHPQSWSQPQPPAQPWQPPHPPAPGQPGPQQYGPQPGPQQYGPQYGQQPPS